MESLPSQRPNNGAFHGLSVVENKKYLRASATCGDPRSPSNGTTAQSPTSPVTSPPYWEPSHQRSSSNISVESMLPGAITLEDNTGDDDDKNQACWARSVYIKDYVVVNGSSTGIGSFVVWNITVETLRVSTDNPYHCLLGCGRNLN